MQTQSKKVISMQALTLLDVFSYWLPLALSWLLILLENPVINAAMARLDAPELALAAFGIVMSMSVVIESLIVPLLSTVNALSINKQHYFVLKRFSWTLTLITVGIHALVSFTPLYNIVIVKWISLPIELIDPVHLGMKLMLPWSGFIAWRRFNQGILIRNGETKPIGRGTIIRLVSLILSVVVYGFFTPLPGIAAASLAAISGTFFEAVYIQFQTTPLIRNKIFSGDLDEENEESNDELNYRDLTIFYIPLFASTLLFFLARPMVSAALARTPNPTLALAAWPVFTGLISLVRAPAISMPEVAISLGKKQENFELLKKFAIYLSFGSLIFFLLTAFTPFRMVYFKWLMGVSEDLIEAAISGAVFALLTPIFGPYTGFLRGILTLNRNTIALTIATAANVISMAITLLIGVRMQLPGVPLGAAAMSISYVAEFIAIMIAFEWMNKKKKSSVN
jgi:hypothetical protein